jgi:hypothetical protein
VVQNLAWGEEVSPEFAERVRQIAGKIGCDPNHLMACMKFESGLDSRAVNRTSGATGLIQFMPRTAKGLATTTSALLAMTPVRQLDYVEKYFSWFGKLANIDDLYMAILWPAAIGKPSDYVLFRDSVGAYYRQNKGLDANHDGKVTKAEAAAQPRGLLERKVGPIVDDAPVADPIDTEQILAQVGVSLTELCAERAAGWVHEFSNRPTDPAPQSELMLEDV